MFCPNWAISSYVGVGGGELGWQYVKKIAHAMHQVPCDYEDRRHANVVKVTPWPNWGSWCVYVNYSSIVDERAQVNNCLLQDWGPHHSNLRLIVRLIQGFVVSNYGVELSKHDHLIGCNMIHCVFTLSHWMSLRRHHESLTLEAQRRTPNTTCTTVMTACLSPQGLQTGLPRPHGASTLHAQDITTLKRIFSVTIVM